MLLELVLTAVLQQSDPIPACSLVAESASAVEYASVPCAITATDGSVVVVEEDSAPTPPEQGATQEATQEASGSDQQGMPVRTAVLLIGAIIVGCFVFLAAMG